MKRQRNRSGRSRARRRRPPLRRPLIQLPTARRAALEPLEARLLLAGDLWPANDKIENAVETELQTRELSILPAASEAETTNGDTFALFDSLPSAFFYKNMMGPGVADGITQFGPAAAAWVPLAGDWDADGADSFGLYDASNGVFFLKNTIGPGAAETIVQFGPAGQGWVPLVGDWDGDGTSTVGLFEPTTSSFFLKNTNAAGPADVVFQFGPANADWVPVAGDWDGDGNDSVALYSGSGFFQKNTFAPGVADAVFSFGPEGADWVPLAGDWDADGTDTVALFESSNSVFFFKNTNAAGPGDGTVQFGPAGANWTPLAGDWDGTITTAPTEVHLTVPDLLTLDVGSIEYFDPSTVGAGEPVALLREAVLSFTDLPGELVGLTSVALDELDGYDDDGDGLIDGFGLSTSIELGEIELAVGDATLLALAGVTLGVNGLQVRPQLNDGFRTGELVFDAQGVELLPDGLSGVFGLQADEPLAVPGIGSIDINSGAFELGFDIPAAVSQSLTLSGWVPLRLTRFDAAWDPGDSSPMLDFALGGFVAADQLASRLGSALGSPNLAVTVRRYDEQSTSFVELSATNPLTVGVTYTSGELRPTNTPALKVDLENLEFDLGGSVGSLTLDGYLAVGGFDGLGLPQLMPSELGLPFADQQLAGLLTVVSASSLGQASGTITLGGTLDSADGVSQLSLTGVAQLAVEVALPGVTTSSEFEANFQWTLDVDHTTGTPTFSGLPTLDSIQATNLSFVVENVVRFDIGQIDYLSSPAPGSPVAVASGASITLLGALAGANVTGSADLSLFDDDGDGAIDGVSLDEVQLSLAAGQTWDYPAGPMPLLRGSDLTATLSGLTYRPALSGFEPQGQIELALGEVALYPDGGGPFDATVLDTTGTIDAVTGELFIALGELTIGLGPDSLFEVEVLNAGFRLDADETTDILTVSSATLRLLDAVGSLDAASFSIANFRFNLVEGLARFGLDSVLLNTPQGLLGSLGLAGFLPLDVTQAGLTFADDSQGYTDFTDFVLSLDGYFDLSLLEAALPFDPTLSIGDVPAGTVDTPHTFTGIDFGFDLAAGRITPINLADLTLGFSNWQIGELIFAGELVAAGYVDGILQPSLTGHVGIDVAAADNKVQPGDGTGVDLYGAEIALTGTIQQSAGLTSLVVDAQAGLSFDLRLGDFLQLSDLGFNFGLDIEVADNFLDDPPALVDVTPRLESMSVGTLIASLGDYVSLGAVPGSGGEPGLMIDFDPAANEPLAVFNFNVQSPLIGLSGTIEGLAILQGGVPDFDSLDQIDIALVERGDGSPSLLQDFFSEFMPLNISRIALAFQDGFFEFDGPAGGETIVGIADPTKLNLITSGQAGLPDWLPEEFAFEVGGEFTNLELDLAKLVNGEFAIVDLGGLGFEAGVDFEAFKIFGALTVGSVDADPGPGEETIFYAAIAGAFEIGGYGAEGALVLTTAGPIGATLSVPLAIPIAQTGFLITGAAGSIQFGTVLLPEPEEIQRPSDLGDIPNPFDIQLSSAQFIENLVQSLWVTADGGYVRPTWTEPVTLALQGQLTHVAVAKLLTGTVTVAANLTLPVGGATVDDAGLALLGFGDIRAFDLPFVDAKVVFDLRDELNPSLGFYIQAPSTGNPFGILFPAQADFGALLRTDGLAMATAVGLRAFFTQLADGVLSQGQVFFENVAGQILDILQSDADESALAELVEPLLPAGQTFLDLSTQDFIVLLGDVLELDDVLDQLAAGGGQTIEQLAPALQDKLSTVLALSNAILQDVLRFGPRVIEAGLDDALTTGEQLVALGLRNPGQENDPLDPFELLANFDPENLAAERVIPIELVSEFSAVLIDTLGSAAFEAFAQTAAFVVSDSFDPRLLIEGALQPTLLGIPVGDPPGSVQLTVSKRGVSFGLDASIIRMLKLIGGAPLGPLALLMNAAPDVTDQTTIAYELPFNSTEILQSLAAGELSLAALNPFSPDWGQLVASQIRAIAADFAVSIVQFGPGSTLLENNVQIVDDFDDPVDPGKIPVTSQALLDRMRSLGGFLFTGGSLQAKLLTDPFEVILNLLDAARQAGEELETADDEFQYLAQLFSTVPSFLEAVQDSLQEMEEFARVQAYLPISYATLLPQEIQDLLDGDTEAFNEAFLDLFFDADGNIRDEAVLDVLDQLGAQIQDSASTIAANMFYEGVLNSKLLGIELANGRIFGGVLPDPDNPGQTLDYGNSAITVTGTIPWLGGLQVEAVLDKQFLPLPPEPASGPDPLAPLRAFYGDAVPLPRGRVDLTLDTTAPPGGTSDFELVLDSLGLDASLFQLPDVGQADASLRALTPGYDLTSSDPIERVGGLEFLANLSIHNVVDSAAFSVRMAPPVAGPGGTYLPFTGRASADEITLGGLTISNANFELISDAAGLRIGIEGEAELLGAMFSVKGELDSQFRGNLSLTLQSGETLAGAFGGFSGSGSFTLMLNGPTDGSIAFIGSLNNLPGTGGGALNVAGEIEANGDFDLASSTTNLSFAGFTINAASLRVTRQASTVEVHVEGNGTTSLLGATFRVGGTLNSGGAGTLDMSLAAGLPSFGGLSGSGSFNLVLSSASSGSVSFSGTLSGVPGKGGSALAMSGSIFSSGNFSVNSSATGLSLGGFSISSAVVTIARSGSTTSVSFSGNSSLSLLGTTFRVSGSLNTSGNGTLTLTQTGGTPSFGGLSASGTFNLVLSNASSGSVSFSGTLSGVPGKGSSSLSMSGSIFSSGNFSVQSSATGLSLGGFSINSAVVTVARSGSTTSVSFSGSSSLSLLGTTFRVSGSVNTNGNGTLTLIQTGGTPSFGGLSGNGSFNLVLSNASSGSVSFSGTLSGVPGKGSSSLSMSGSIFSSGNFSVNSSATGLSLGGFSISSAVVTVARSGSTTSVSFSGNSSLSLLGTTFRVSGSVNTNGNGTLTLIQTGGTPSFGGLSGSGTFNLVLSNASSGSVSFSGTLSGVPGKGSSSLSMSGSIFSSGNFSVQSSATGLSLGGFSISSAVVTVAHIGSTTSVSFSGNSSLSLLGASFRVTGSLNTSGNGTLTLNQTSGTPSFGGLSASGTFHLLLSNASSGSVSFSGSLSGVPGKGSSSLSMSGSIFSSGNFSVSSSATSLSLGGFSISSAVVTVARSGSTTTVSYSGNSSLSLLGATFRVSGSLSTSGNGTLSLTLTSGTPKFAGAEASGTFQLSVSNGTSGSVSFDGSVSDIPGGFVSSLDVDGTINSPTSYSVSGSTSVTQTISIVGQPLARIRGTFNLTLASSGFSASITGATIEIRVFDPFSGQFVWQTLVQGTATINSDGTGSLGGFNFTY